MASQALFEEENLGILNTVGHWHCKEGIEAQGQRGWRGGRRRGYTDHELVSVHLRSTKKRGCQSPGLLEHRPLAIPRANPRCQRLRDQRTGLLE